MVRKWNCQNPTSPMLSGRRAAKGGRVEFSVVCFSFCLCLGGRMARCVGVGRRGMNRVHAGAGTTEETGGDSRGRPSFGRSRSKGPSKNFGSL